MSARPKILRPLLVFTAGLALGVGAVRSLLRPDAEPSARNAKLLPGPSASAAVASPSPAFILPPPLSDSEADEAIDAYLALAPLDPKATAPEIRERLGRLRALLTLLPDSHFPRLLDVLATREGNPEGRLRRAALEVWIEHDAQAATRWAFALVPGAALNAQTRTSYVSLAALAWGRDDFAAAYAWAGALGDAPLRASLLPRLVGQLAATDPRQAIALAAQGDGDFTRAAQRSVFDAWAAKDPVAALKALGPTLRESNQDTWRLQQAFTKWAAREPAAALDWALAQPPPDHSRSHTSLLNIGWGLAQTPGAVGPFLDLVHRRTDIPDRSSTIHNLLGAWARHDPAAAGAWLDTLPDPAERSDYVARSLGYLQEKPDAFLDLVRRLPSSSDRDDKVLAHISSWAERDPDAALTWLEKTKDPILAAAAPRLEGLLLGQLAASDPATALARWQNLPASAQSPALAAQFASHWGKTDPAAATAWLLERLPAQPSENPNDHQAYAQMQNLASTWARNDLPAYLAWAQKLPPGTQREYALHALSAATANYAYQPIDPPPRAAFAEQLAQIQDPALRERVLRSHLYSWLRSDVHAARAWILSSDALSPEAAARLLTQGH